MAKSKRKKKTTVYRMLNNETGEHYTIRLGKEGYDALSTKSIMKFSRKLRKHAEFKLSKKVK